jgi:hypothetical protein
MLDDARLQLHNELIASTGQTVTIYPADGSTPVEGVSALKGASSSGDIDTDMPGYTITYQGVDWLIDSAELDSDYVPAVGDVIEDARGKKYIVTAGEDDNRTWRWSSQSEIVMRIHSKPEDVR